MYKSRQGPGQVSCLLIGTENKELLVMDPLGSTIVAKKALLGVPCFIACVGVLDVDYRIIVVCRNGSVYQIKKGIVIGIYNIIYMGVIRVIRVMLGQEEGYITLIHVIFTYIHDTITP